MDDIHKRDAMRDSLRRGFTVRVVVDTKLATVPDYLRAHPLISLDYAEIMVPMIADLDAADDGIHGTLSFKGLPFKTFVPWAAVVKMGPLPKKDADVTCRYCGTDNRPKATCRRCGAPTS